MADSPMYPPHPLPHPDLAGYVLGALLPHEEQRFQQHLAGCADCRAEVAQLAGLPAVLDSLAEEPPEHLQQRTLAAVRRAAARGAPAYDGGAAAGAVERLRRLVSPLLSRRPALVAAALVLLAVVAGVALGFRGQADEPVTVPLTAVAGERGSGEATISRSPEGLTIRLSLTGLEPNPPGTYYECWYVGERDSGRRPERVTGGTFTVRPDGTADVTLTTAADYRQYPGIAVTLENDDGDPGTTGPVVLVSRSG